MKHAHLGDLDVARIGLGAMGMSGSYSGAGGDAESIRTIHRAVELGVTLIDTAEMYGPYANEELVGRALKGRREIVVLATKFGFISHTGRPEGSLDSSPDNIRAAVEGSLRRLGTDHIDLYYQHRVDRQTPIEDTIGAWPSWSPRARSATSDYRKPAQALSAVRTLHPITAVQSEYSLWTRPGTRGVAAATRPRNRLGALRAVGPRIPHRQGALDRRPRRHRRAPRQSSVHWGKLPTQLKDRG